MMTTPFHIQVIREALSKRQRANPAYSLRAFSRDLGVEPSTLSQILKGKRPLPAKDCDPVATGLRLLPRDRARFLESALRKRTPFIDSIPIAALEERVTLDESHYRVIAEWEHYAALTLAEADGDRLTIEAVARRFALSRLRAEAVVQNLVNAGLLRAEHAHFVRCQSSVRTTEDVASQALRDSHLETLELGKRKLESTPIELRDYSSINVALNADQLPELKTIIREFRQKVTSLARAAAERRDVYQLALQLYPLTELEKSE